MGRKLEKHVLRNGMVILGEPRDAVESVAFGLNLPARAACHPEGGCGAGNVIAYGIQDTHIGEWIDCYR